MHKILTIAGSDSGGCAGIQADLRVINHLGCHGTTVITAITAQNTLGVQSIFPLPGTIIQTQVDSILRDIGADAIKIGMLFNEEIILAVADVLSKYPSIPIVLDPVCIATSGDVLLQPAAIKTLVNQLMPKTTLLTPNKQEAALLLAAVEKPNKHDFTSTLGIKNCLITGGDTTHHTVDDILYSHNSNTPHKFNHPKIKTRHTHGSGCSLSSAIACFIAMGKPLKKAIAQAIQLISSGIVNGASLSIGQGAGPLHFQS